MCHQLEEEEKNGREMVKRVKGMLLLESEKREVNLRDSTMR